MGLTSVVLTAARRLRRLLCAVRPGRGQGLRAGESARQPGAQGVDEIARSQVRRRVRVCGVLEAVTYGAGKGGPALVGHLADGTGRLDLVWLGQRRVAGIAPGRRLVAEGMVAGGRTRPRIYNPTYELLGPCGPHDETRNPLRHCWYC